MLAMNTILVSPQVSTSEKKFLEWVESFTCFAGYSIRAILATKPPVGYLQMVVKSYGIQPKMISMVAQSGVLRFLLGIFAFFSISPTDYFGIYGYIWWVQTVYMENSTIWHEGTSLTPILPEMSPKILYEGAVVGWGWNPRRKQLGVRLF